ncbi:uncharacterized protein LOC130656407 [Hydractinia symbiolongicarpus]|uniref:uncharacterized protein LOC130656407 n=1 Tax=Hydractinia symbiolongicarpus TaxID=13093 RepID=UPI00254A291F|nr:uncharacterized protein LOC130656407 [Hydractinia symbiolongicarpus]
MVLWLDILAKLLYIFSIVKGDILRLDTCNKFYAAFDVVYDNSLLTKTVFSLVENIVLNRCLIICVQYPKCKSFSYMFSHSQCRIHHSTRADNGTFLQKIVGWTHYETRENEPNLGRLCEVRKPCKYGRCVDTCDEKGYKCEFKGEWTLLKDNVCFGAKSGEFGTFEIQQDAVMTGMKLLHVGGDGVKCANNTPLTKWGCNYASVFILDNIGIFITANRTILYPSREYEEKFGFSHIPGYNANSPYLIFNATNHTVYKGQELQLYYAEDYHDSYAHDNDGKSCADIYAKLIDA